MHVFFKVREGQITVYAVQYNGYSLSLFGSIADVVWRVTPERIEWVKDRWNEEHTDNARKYGYAFIQDVTNGMSAFANALCVMLGLKPDVFDELNEPSGSTRVSYSQDSCDAKG